MAPAPPPSRTQSRSGRTLFHHLLLLTTTVLFLCVDLLPPMASAAHVVDCRRVVFHPYCRGISARRASYTAEQMKGLNSLQESDNPPFLLEDPGLPNGLNSLEQQQPQQPLPITFINEAGQPQTLEMPTSISRQLTKGKVDQEQQQQQQQQLETERDDGGRPRESSSSSSSLLSRGQQVRPTPTSTPTSTTPSHSPPPSHRPVRPLYGDAIVRVLLLRQNALLRLPTYRAHERDRERSGSWVLLCNKLRSNVPTSSSFLHFSPSRKQQPLTTFVPTSLSSPSARMDPYYRHPQQQQQQQLYYSHPRSYSYPHYSRHHHHHHHNHHHPSPSSPSSYSPISPADLGGHYHQQYPQSHHRQYHHKGRQSPNSRSHRAPRHRNPFTPVAPYDLDYFPYYKRASVL
ncbi:hypothetical protein TYRP_022798 [Tyrophagus putrescentiae]|nr:hypothetical protein TYRP_022798 [Tyrophagus putrescentiae]